MKALVIILAALLVLSHPVAVAVALGAETAAVAGLGWLAWRGLRPVVRPLIWVRGTA